MVEVKEKIESNCGISCSTCHYKSDGICSGCLNITHPFWGESCPIKSCNEKKGITCCGKCKEFPCDLLKSYAYDEKEGDNGLRIENCKKWCSIK